jgi:hypothetical protein
MSYVLLAAALLVVAGMIVGAIVDSLVLERRRRRPSLAEVRLARLLDPDDDLSDLSLAEIRAVEQRGRDHLADVRHGIYRARQAYTTTKRGG